MNIVKVGNIHAATIGEVLTIVRGQTAFHLPVSELASLQSALQQLSSDAPKNNGKLHASKETTATVSPVQRRGRMWEAVREHLQSAGRAKGFKTLLAFVKRNKLTDRNPSHALKIALGKKVSAGELVVTPSGRYALSMTASKSKASATSASRKRRSSGKPRGQLWDRLKRSLDGDSEGQTLAELVDRATAESWTNAKNPELAVKISLGRAASEIHKDAQGRYRLAAAAPPRKSTVVRRRAGEVIAPKAS